MEHLWKNFIWRFFKVLPFRKVIEHLCNLKLKYEEEGNDLMIDLLKSSMISLYGQWIRNDIDEEYIIISESWILKKIDETVVDYEHLANGE